MQLPVAATGTTTISEGGKTFTNRHFTPYASYAHAAHYPKGMTIDYIAMDYPGAWQLTVVQIMEVSSAAGCDGYFTLSVLEANQYLE